MYKLIKNNTFPSIGQFLFEGTEVSKKCQTRYFTKFCADSSAKKNTRWGGNCP